MDFITRDEWRRRGRPKTPVDPAVIGAVRHTYREGLVGRISVAGASAAEVRATITQLRRAAEELGLVLRLQPRRSKDIVAAGELRFYGEDA